MIDREDPRNRWRCAPEAAVPEVSPGFGGFPFLLPAACVLLALLVFIESIFASPIHRMAWHFQSLPKLSPSGKVCLNSCRTDPRALSDELNGVQKDLDERPIPDREHPLASAFN